MNYKDKDYRYMKMAHELAKWSKEKGRKVGAVVVGVDDEIRSTGFNGFPRGVNEEIDERQCRETGEKYFWSSHAERNAIYNAARIGVALQGCRIYVPWFPCGECAKAIIQSGIVELIGYEPDFEEPKWGADFKKVVQMLNEGGVRVRYIPEIEALPDGY